MEEKVFKMLEPCFVGPMKVKATRAADSICPVIDITIGKDADGAVLVGYGTVEKLRDMCNYALSTGEWWYDSLPEGRPKPKPPKCYHIYDYADYTETHTVCRKCGFKSPKPDPKWPDFKYHAQPCKYGSMNHDWYDGDEEIGVCKKCFAIGITHKRFDRELIGELRYQLILPKIIANIIINDLMKHANEKGCKVKDLGLESSDLRWLGSLILEGILDRSKVSTAIDHFIKNGGKIKEIITELGLWSTYDNKLEEMVDKVIEDNPKIVEQILGGKKKALGSLIGKLKQVDKNIDSKEAMELLKEKING